MQYAGFSGGKDSSAMVLRLAELGEEFEMICTPTGNELPEVAEYVQKVAVMIDRPLHVLPTKTLFEWIDIYNALPSWRMRWCTRLIKIQPTIKFLTDRPGSTLMVGLRADEEEREGLYGPYCEYRYPLREWGWKIDDVRAYVANKGLKVPVRSDCALCYDQRIGEWWNLWKKHPAQYAKGEELEAKTGFTLRSPGRDMWPAKLSELRQKFEEGRVPSGSDVQMQMWEDDEKYRKCRVCTL